MATTERQEQEIARFDAGREQIVVRVSEFKGKQYLDVRRYWQDDEGEWAPSKKGCSIPAEIAADVVNAMTAGVRALTKP